MNSDSIAETATSSGAHALTSVPLQAAERAPKFDIDPSWPRPLPEGWITGQLAGVCVDHDDNIIVTNRGDITKEEQETCVQAPAVLIFDPAGHLIDSWGEWDVLPRTIHSCCVDADNNVWITANGDGMVQKYTHDGKLVLQIGTKGVFETSDGTRSGTPLNSGRTAFIKPAGITVDQTNGDVYIAEVRGRRAQKLVRRHLFRPQQELAASALGRGSPGWEQEPTAHVAPGSSR